MPHPVLSPEQWCRALLIALLALGPIVRDARGADPQPYTVAITTAGQHPDLERALRAASMLISLGQKAPVGPFALVTRARDDARRFATVLESFGYYAGKVEIRIAGKPLDDPALVPLLERTPSGTAVAVDARITPGPLFHIRNISVRGNLPADIRAHIGIAPGDPAVAKNILAVRGRLLDALQQRGHAFAEVSQPDAVVTPREHVMDVSWSVKPGPRVDIGPIRLEGLKTVNPGYVRRLLPLRPGQLYQPSVIEKARQDLASLDVFSAVQARAAERLNQQGLLPVTFVFTEAPSHVVSLGALYSTDLGAAVNASWTDRNLFGNGEKLTISAAATELGGTASLQPGYNVGASLLIPAWLQRGQELEFDLNALKQYLETYQQTAYTAGVTLRRKFGAHLSGSIGLNLEQEHIVQEDVGADYTLLSLPITLKFDNTDNLFEPTRGFRATATVIPTESLGGQSGHTPFFTMQASASTYIDLFGNGRSILALRGTVGSILGATQFEIPPDRRFYAGGSDTVRGYKYQWISPHFPDGIPEGGAAIDAGTIEFRQRIAKSWGAALFVDAGQVSAGNTPFAGPLAVGVGAGVRYFTGFGPIRLDVAVPLTRVEGNDRFEFYVGIGEAF